MIEEAIFCVEEAPFKGSFAATGVPAVDVFQIFDFLPTIWMVDGCFVGFRREIVVSRVALFLRRHPESP